MIIELTKIMILFGGLIYSSAMESQLNKMENVEDKIQTVVSMVRGSIIIVIIAIFVAEILVPYI